MEVGKDIGVQFLEHECKPSEVPKLKRIGFTITYNCDGNCTYCFTKPDKTPANAGKEISAEEFKEVLKQAIPLGLEEIQLSGGEPLMHKDVFEFVRTAKHAGLRVGLFTNGSMLDKETLRKLKSHKLDWIRVGLGGSDYKMSMASGRLNDTKERFEKNLENIRSSVQAGFVTGAFTPVTKNDYKDVRRTAALARGLGVKYIIFCNYIPLGNEQDKLNRMNSEEHRKAVEELLRAREDQRGKVDVFAYYGFFEYLSSNWKESDVVLKGPCGRERLAFIANGDVRTCLCTTHKLDNFRRDGFDLRKLWETHSFLLEIRKNRIFEPCNNCKRNGICKPCLTPAININGRIDTAPPQCPRVRDYNMNLST